jgi:hypothetical protein
MSVRMSACLLSCGCMCWLIAMTEPVVRKRWPLALAAVAWAALAVAMEIVKARE